MVTTLALQVPESFFEDASQFDEQLTFEDMNLSRPILKVPSNIGRARLGSLVLRWVCPVLHLQAITALGFKQPTPIQKACVPVGLLGRDLCACAATGTGDTDTMKTSFKKRPREQFSERGLLISRENGGIHVARVGAFGLQAKNITGDPSIGSGSYQRVGDPGSLCDPPAGTVHLHHHLLGCWYDDFSNRVCQDVSASN